MTEELILKPFERVSVSKLDTFEMCPRHYHFQFAYELEEVETDVNMGNGKLTSRVQFGKPVYSGARHIARRTRRGR